MHSVVAHIYRRPGSVGATFNSFSVNAYFVDCPAVMLVIPFWVGGVPAEDVPQY